MNSKQLMVCAAIIEILQIFADTEIGGQYEIDYDKIADYVNSFRCSTEYFECSTKEEVYERFTQDIYAGLPVWRWLKLPEWTVNMVERTFEDECQAEYREMCRIYKCLTCKHYEAQNTEIGVFHQCNYRKEGSNRMYNKHFHSLKRDEPFELKKKCRNYEIKALKNMITFTDVCDDCFNCYFYVENRESENPCYGDSERCDEFIPVPVGDKDNGK